MATRVSSRLPRLTPRGVEAFVTLLTFLLFLATMFVGLRLLEVFGQDAPSAPSARLTRGLDLPVGPERWVEDPPAPVATPAVGPRARPTLVLPPPPGPVVTDVPPPVATPPKLYGVDVAPVSPELLVLIDASGSMLIAHDGVTRLDRAKGELGRLWATLPQAWRVNAGWYDCDAPRWAIRNFASSEVLLAPAHDALPILEAWTAGITANGGTGTGPAVEAACWYAPPECRHLILVTDGAPSCGAGSGDPTDPACHYAHRDRIRIANRNRGPARMRIDVIAIDAVGPYRQFAADVAADNGGTFTEVH